jgi:hypothetical protein
MTQTLYTAAPQWAMDEAEELHAAITLSGGSVEHLAHALAKVRADALTEAANYVDAFGEKRTKQLGGLLSGAMYSVASDIRALKESK